MSPGLERALRAGDAAALRALLGAGENADARDAHGQSALMLAARFGHREVVEVLLAAGAGLDHHAKYGLTALMLAVLNGHDEIARGLARAGADLAHRANGAPGFAGKTASELAAARGALALAAELAPRARG